MSGLPSQIVLSPMSSQMVYLVARPCPQTLKPFSTIPFGNGGPSLPILVQKEAAASPRYPHFWPPCETKG